MQMHMNTTPSSEETQYGTLRWPFTDACTPTSPSHRFRTKKPQQKQKQTGTRPDQDTHTKCRTQIIHTKSICSRPLCPSLRLAKHTTLRRTAVRPTIAQKDIQSFLSA